MVVIIEEVPQDSSATRISEEPVSESAPSGPDAEDMTAEADEWVRVEASDAVSPKVPSGDAPEGSQDTENFDPQVLAERNERAENLKLEGNKLFAMGDIDAAIDMYTQALEVCPLMSHNQRAVYFANRAACYMRQEEHAQAAIECSAALELNPSYTKALIRRALAFEAIGELEKALVDLQKAKELDPGNVSVAELLARVGPAVEKQREAMKEEMMGKLKELGNTVLGKFGLSLDNFKAEKDPSTGSYSIKFQQ